MHMAILRNRPAERNEKKSPTDSRPVRQSLPPGARLPESIACDPRIPPKIKAFLAAVTTFCYGVRPCCWPSDASLARKLGRSKETIQRYFRWCERWENGALLWRYPADNAVGREIVVLFRLNDGKNDVPPPARMTEAPTAKMPSRSLKGGEKKNQCAVGGMATQGPPPPAQDNPEAAQGHPGGPREHDPAAAESSKHATMVVAAKAVLAGFMAGANREALISEGVVGDEAIRALAGVPLSGAEPPTATIAAPPPAPPAPSGRRSSLPPPREPQPYRPAQGRRPGRFRGRGAVALGEILGHSQVAVSCVRAAGVRL